MIGVPLYIINNAGKQSVIGIQSKTGNRAVRINSDILHFIYNNPNIN